MAQPQKTTEADDECQIPVGELIDELVGGRFWSMGLRGVLAPLRLKANGPPEQEADDGDEDHDERDVCGLQHGVLVLLNTYITRAQEKKNIGAAFDRCCWCRRRPRSISRRRRL